MKRILIACSMMEDEINKIYQEENCEMPVVWMDRGYHNTPDKLKEKLQEKINELQDYDEILLAFGLCGNGTEGLVSENTALIIPRFDDCLNMLLCGEKRMARGLTEAGKIYLTRGWTMDDEAILAQYEKYIEEYDEESAEAIMEMMYQHYEKIAVIDTESYHMESVMEYAKKAAQLLDLSTETVKGSTRMLKQLLTGNWDENFIIQKPGQPVRTSSFEWEITG